MGKTSEAGSVGISRLKKLDLEFASILLSLGGAVGALIYQQTALAIVPFSVSLGLGWRNREEQLRKIGSQATDFEDRLQTLISQAYQERTEPAQIAQAQQEIDKVKGSLETFGQNLTQVEQKQNQQSFGLNTLKSSTVEINSRLTQFDAGLLDLQHGLQTLNQAFEQRAEPQQIGQAQKEISDIRSSLADLHHLAQGLGENASAEKTAIQEQIASIGQELSQVEKSLRDQSRKVNELDNFTTDISAKQSQFDAGLYDWLNDQFKQLNQCLQSVDHKYELVCDRGDSRKKLLEAINTAQKRLILVCPWVSYGMTQEVSDNLDKFLSRHPNAKLDIGWGHLNDINKLPAQLRSAEGLIQSNDFYKSVPQLVKLQKKYSGRCRLKLLGTHEKFIICDHKFAVIGSHNFLTSTSSSAERELGLYTTNPSIIHEMIRRFDNARDLQDGSERGRMAS